MKKKSKKYPACLNPMIPQKQTSSIEKISKSGLLRWSNI